MSKNKRIYFLTGLFALFCMYVTCNCRGSDPIRLNNYWQAQEWRTATPESQGLDSEELAKAFDYIQEEELNIHSLMVIRNGYQVLNAHFYPYEAGTVHNQASVT
ncbi:MAG: 6-aminohexanoate hydrolase, partial [bacterium]